MPKKKNYESVSTRPHRNMKAKVVFDPSDSHLPKKKAKYSYKNEKLIEAPIKKTTNDKKKQDTTKLNSSPVNLVTESLACSSIEASTTSSSHSQINSAVKNNTPKIALKISKKCYICKKPITNKELVDCPICLIRVHRECLIVNEPVWKFKLDLSSWFCKECRKTTCSKCLKDKSQSVMYTCISCDVGLHSICYESYDIKPLHKIESESSMYVCIPCMTMATQINEEEKEEEIEDDAELCTSDSTSSSFAEVDLSCTSNNGSDILSNNVERIDDTDDSIEDDTEENDIPNTLKWSKEQVLEYLEKRLPQEVVNQITKYNLDGQSLHLLERSNIVSNMGLKLGHALKLYKEVKILQTQSNHCRLFWE